LFRDAEIFLGVGREARRRRDGEVGRVDIGEVTLAGFLERVSEVLDGEVDVAQRPVGRQQVVAVIKRGVFVRADGDVELAATVDALQAIEASLVEEDHARGTFERVGQVMPVADGVIVVLPVFVEEH